MQGRGKPLKWVFLAFLLILTPMLATLLKSKPKWLPLAALVLGVLPFVQGRFHLSANPIAWPFWQGTTKGIEFTLIDAISVAIIFATHRIKASWPLKAALTIYLLGFSVSTAMSSVKMADLFYGWTIVRTVIVFYALARASKMHPKVPEAFLTGMIIGIASQAVVTSIEFAGGARQAGGWFGHQNLLGMVTHFTVYPAFALFLAGRAKKRTGFAVAACLLIAFTGGSRATIGLMGIGLFITLILSCSLQITRRKRVIAGATFLASLIIAPVLYTAIARRSSEARQASTDEREKMMASAAMILSDYPFGVGANRFVSVSSVGGYRARSGVNWVSAAAPVHNSWYLVAAEMGWIGVTGFLAIVLAALATCFTAARRARGTLLGDYSTGLVATVAMVALHSYQEWITMLSSVHQIFGMSLGIATATLASSRLSAKARGRRPMLQRADFEEARTLPRPPTSPAWDAVGARR